MPARRKAPRVRLTISCLDSEWERIREIAARRGVSINDHAVSAGLSVELGPPQDAPALALSEAEQRRLLDRVDRLADSMLPADVPVVFHERLRAEALRLVAERVHGLAHELAFLRRAGEPDAGRIVELQGSPGSPGRAMR